MKKTVSFFIIILLGALVATYFTLDRSKSFEFEQAKRLEYEDMKKTYLQNWGKTRERSKQFQEDLTGLIRNREEMKVQLSSIRGKIGQLEDSIATAQGKISAHEANLANIRTKRVEVQDRLQKLGEGITIDNLADKIEEAEEDQADLTKELSELEVVLVAANKKLEDTKSTLERLESRETDRAKRIQMGSMQASITGANHDWGFVVIGAGSDDGFTPQSTLIVERNGQMIGRVRPSSIEAHQTLAEIIYKAMAPGVRFQAGDKVILPATSSN